MLCTTYNIVIDVGQDMGIYTPYDRLDMWITISSCVEHSPLDILLSSHKLVTKGNKLDFCSNHIYGKQVKSIYYIGSSRKTVPLELMHSNLCTIPTKSLVDSLHFIAFIDDYSKKSCLYY